MKLTLIKNISIIGFVSALIIMPDLNFYGPIKAQKTSITSAPSIKRRRPFRVDFRDVDIQDFLKAMSGIIRKNIMADDRVKGKITVISPRKIPRRQAYAYLTSVLAVKGYGVIDDGILLKIVPLKDAVAKSPVILLGRLPIDPEHLAKNTIVTHIVPVLSSKPSRLAGLLKRVTSPNTNIIDYDEANTLIITGEASEVNRVVRIIVEIDPDFVTDEPSSRSFGNIHVYRLENMQADKVEATLRRVRLPDNTKKGKNSKSRKKSVGPTGSLAKSNIEVIAHKESNSLIFIGTKEDFKPIKNLIEQIDLPRDQVLLEVLIVEVSAIKGNSFGIDWRYSGPGYSSQFNTSTLKNSGRLDSTKGTADILGINSLLGFSLGFISDSQATIAAMVEANVNNENFAVLSAPQILTLDNQEAVINVGEDIPIISGNRQTGAGTTAVDFFSYEYKKVGVQVKFTPRINKRGMVTLDLYQEIKTAQDSTDTTVNPRFSTRDIKTSVRVADGQTIVIGGLISTDKTKTERKIPLLGDIPILGFLFKRTGTSMQKKNLLVFITPHILVNRQVADNLTDEAFKKYNEQIKKMKFDK